ncbi:SDR family NAD(P)-dependent oxidoreductase [Nocardia harenae]|uniref:SDR family NAD(P)-dependent oxidoreductase n=1 Tax=Nocardia harenae TaxID=358707 RepID=UPI00082A401B|nr:glucose 1-dehydrogenase [Nocardia harenae]
MSRLAGKVAIVTGAAAGLGAEFARQFVAEGAQVVLADIAEAEGAAVAHDLGKNAHFIRLDITDPAQWRTTVEETRAMFGPPTVLVNNAGIVEFGSFLDASVDSMRRTLDVNVIGAWLGIQAVVPSMTAAGGGSIVNVSSDAGMKGYPRLSAYVSSKWAVRGLTRSAALELGHRGIRVNAVLPGLIDTPMGRGSLHGLDPSDVLADSPTPRIGRPEEVAALMVFLASDESGYCSGADYQADGGMLAGNALRGE